jgi:hypothetical protein
LNPLAFLSNEPPPHILELQFSGWKGLRAKLVLEALNRHPVELAAVLFSGWGCHGGIVSTHRCEKGADPFSRLGFGKEDGHLGVGGTGEPFEAADGPGTERDVFVSVGERRGSSVGVW